MEPLVTSLGPKSAFSFSWGGVWYGSIPWSASSNRGSVWKGSTDLILSARLEAASLAFSACHSAQQRIEQSIKALISY